MPPPFGVGTYRIDPVNPDGTPNWISIGKDTADCILDVQMNNTTGFMQFGSTNGATTGIYLIEELVTLSGATTSSSIQFPDGCIILAATARVNSTITGCTSWQMGVSGTPTLWATGMALSVNTKVDFKHAQVVNPTSYDSGAPILFTAVGGGASFTGGTVRLCIHYIKLTAPTS
jgi:hypothetical protein